MEQNEDIKPNINKNIINCDNTSYNKKEQAKNKRAAKLAFRNQFASQEEYEAAMQAKNPNYRPSKRRKIIQEKQEESKNTQQSQDHLEDFDHDHVEYEFKNGQYEILIIITMLI